MIVLLEIITLVLLIQYFFRSSLGKKNWRLSPTPFWIYFVPIVLSTAGFLPHESRTFEEISLHVLPAALILMLIGTPVSSLLKLGPKASLAMAIGSVTMVVAITGSFAGFVKFLRPIAIRERERSSQPGSEEAPICWPLRSW